MDAAPGHKICPYLGRCDDPGSRYAFATVANCCYSQKRRFPIDSSYQARTCLGQEWRACVRYRTALGPAVDDEPATARPDPKARKGRRRLLIVAGAALAVVLITAAAAGLSGLRNPPLQPTLAPSLPASTQSGVALSTDTPPPSPTPSPADTAASGREPPSPTPTVSRAPTARPSPSAVMATRTAAATATHTPRPSPTATSTPSPSATASRTPTPTRSVTPTRTPTGTPGATRSPTRRPPASPTATATPLAAPALLAPADGHVFAIQDEIVLEWQPSGPLPPDAYYLVTVTYLHQGAMWSDLSPWTRDSSWRASEHSYLLDLSDDGRFRWSVQVMHRTGQEAAGNPTGTPISPPSDTRTFEWREGSPGGPGPAPTRWATPTEPPA